MSFGFQFDDEELDEEYRHTINAADGYVSPRNRSPSPEAASSTTGAKAKRHTLAGLLSALPSRISYSTLTLPSKGASNTLFRRDLFDARFQLINDDQDEEAGADRFSAGTQTDLIPGVYEGGFKTWECAIDLAAHLEDLLSREERALRLDGLKVTELGCGTALPSLYLFSRMLSAKEDNLDSSLVLCDFNEQVLRLVTLPNFFLTWYFYDSAQQADATGEVEVTPETVERFKSTMSTRGITFDFYSGSWDSLDEAGAFDQSGSISSLVLTSETLYSMQSLPSLVNALEAACHGSIESSLQKATLTDGKEEESRSRTVVCLVAAKMLYFGVGGGVNAFNEAIKRRQGSSRTVWKSDRGVSRLVLQVDFESSSK